MDKSVEMKRKVLGMLEDFMMGEHGKRMKPKAIEVEMISSKPMGKEGLKDVLDKASEDEEFEGSSVDEALDSANAKKAGVSMDKWGDSPEDEEADDEVQRTKKTSLKDFFARK